MKSAKSKRRAWRRGAAAIELAIVAPFIFLLVFASFEFSRMMMVRQAPTNAAREGSRHAALITTQSTTKSKTVVMDQLRGVICQDGEGPIIRVKFSHASVAALPPGTPITTTVVVDCADVSWLPPMFFAGAKISSTSAMIRE